MDMPATECTLTRMIRCLSPPTKSRRAFYPFMPLRTLRTMRQERCSVFQLGKLLLRLPSWESSLIDFRRYPEDVYDGVGTSLGNPWYLATTSMAELFYRAA